MNARRTWLALAAVAGLSALSAVPAQAHERSAVFYDSGHYSHRYYAPPRHGWHHRHHRDWRAERYYRHHHGWERSRYRAYRHDDRDEPHVRFGIEWGN